MFFKKLLHYLNPVNLFRRDTDNVNLRVMHGINKISLWMFLVCVLIMIWKFVLN